MAEIKKSLAADATMYAAGIQMRDVTTSIGTSDELAGAAWLTEKKGNKPSAHRSSVSAADSTADISSATGALDIHNSQYVSCMVDFDDASGSATLFLALYDATGDLLGVTEDWTFTGDATYRDGAAGPYVCPRKVFDVSGASQVLAVVRTLGTGNVINIYIAEL